MLETMCNTRKTVCMILKPKNRDRFMTDDFLSFTIDGCKLNVVSCFRYLGHVLNADVSGDDDICREIKNVFVRTNTLIIS